ncbi:hypothetical protein EJP82_04690 [Paenibacillus anaericanus]|uniref:Nucleotidyltransferase family protein n=1 Tax=Paenibacillus anaericanus TaxID=170367 RepID=A0A433YCS7_9BACL|nr:hypothetical protein [Paenibacillus anaericanus]RUT47680.1 hypothetical protein EJP82_04690 [Paenibacillus anaericanus]
MISDINDNLYSEVLMALRELSVRLQDFGNPWLLGGSCGLWLQGVKLGTPPRDVDIYADMDDAVLLHEQLADVLLDVPRLDESGVYISRLSHYRLGNLTLELVGGFEVKTSDGSYRTEVSNVLHEEAVLGQLEGINMFLMPLSHELLFNLLRERPDRYLAIAEVMRGSMERHLPLLLKLLKRNDWNTHLVNKLADLLDSPTLAEQWFRNRNCEA